MAGRARGQGAAISRGFAAACGPARYPSFLVHWDCHRHQKGRMKTEKDKMLAGELYDPLDARLSQERQRARDLCKLLNDSREDQQEERRRILCELFGKATDA